MPVRRRYTADINAKTLVLRITHVRQYARSHVAKNVYMHIARIRAQHHAPLVESLALGKLYHDFASRLVHYLICYLGIALIINALCLVDPSVLAQLQCEAI
jgi:hypothetical protein